MKKFLSLFLAVSLLICLLSGCDLANLLSGNLLGKQPAETPTLATKATKPTTTEPVETEPPTQPPTEPPTEPTEPLSTSFPYLQEVPAEACIYKEPDPNAAFVQTIGTDGTFTITQEARSADGDRWGKLKSGLGWVNLTDPFCAGPQVPAVTGSHTGKIVNSRECLRAYCNLSNDIYSTFSFMPHETVTDVTFVQVYPVSNDSKTLYTQAVLTPNMPLVITGTFLEFDYFVFSYTDSSGQRHSITISTSFVDPITYFEHN